MGMRESRTQEAFVAALRMRPRTRYRAGQRVVGAKAPFLSNLLARPQSLLGTSGYLGKDLGFTHH